jgi:hypothetical protein
MLRLLSLLNDLFTAAFVLRLSLVDKGRLIGEMLRAFLLIFGVFELLILGEPASTKLVEPVERYTC